MALNVCRRCSALFARGLHRCPQCSGESAYLLDDAAEAEVLAGGPLPGEEGISMAKNTVHGGASNDRSETQDVTEPVAEEVSELVPGASVDADPDPETSDDEDGSAETRQTRAKPAKAARSR